MNLEDIEHSDVGLYTAVSVAFSDYTGDGGQPKRYTTTLWCDHGGFAFFCGFTYEDAWQVTRFLQTRLQLLNALTR